MEIQLTDHYPFTNCIVQFIPPYTFARHNDRKLVQINNKPCFTFCEKGTNKVKPVLIHTGNVKVSLNNNNILFSHVLCKNVKYECYSEYDKSLDGYVLFFLPETFSPECEVTAAKVMLQLKGIKYYDNI